MRVSLFTDRLDDTQRVPAIKIAADIATEHGAAMLVLPGYSLGRGRTDNAILQQLADETGVSIFGEVHNTFLFRPNGRLGRNR